MEDTLVLFQSDYIEFRNYPFKPAWVYSNPIVYSNEIVEVISNYCPPAIKITNGEIIFVPRNQNNEQKLNNFAGRNNIKKVERLENWALICDEFLDTQFSVDDRERAYNLLELSGIDRNRCDSLRERLSKRMHAYNILSGLWEWVYLGLYDVLNACTGNLVDIHLKMMDSEYKEFYKEAMEIANKDRLIE